MNKRRRYKAKRRRAQAKANLLTKNKYWDKLTVAFKSADDNFLSLFK